MIAQAPDCNTKNSEANVSHGQGICCSTQGKPSWRDVSSLEEEKKKLTVDGDSNALRKDKSIFTLEGRNFSEGVDLEVLSAHTLGRHLSDNLDIKTVRLSNS